MNKTLWIIAGANGSGKTTLVNKYRSKFKDTLPFINPDDIAKEIDPGYDGKDAALIQKAGRETINRQREFLESGKSFGFETTFSSKRDIKIINQAKELGYEIRLVYIGIDSPIDNSLRVQKRTNEGGHYVAPTDINRRYYRSMDNLETALKQVDKAYIFDNSKQTHKQIVRLHENKVSRVYTSTNPTWIKEHLPTLDKMITDFNKLLDKVKQQRANKIKPTTNKPKL